MYDRFQELGVPVAITRDTDRTLTRSERLSTMTDTFGNDENVIILSNHINAGGEKGSCSKITFFEKISNLLEIFLFFK